MGSRAVLRLVVSVLAVVAAAALLGRLFLSASASSEEPVKVIVYVKEGARETKLAGGFYPAAAAVTSESVLESFPAGEVEAGHRFSSFDGFLASVSRAAYERLKANPNLEVYKDGFSGVMLDGSAPLVNSTITHGLVYNSSNITGNTISVCVIDTGVNYSHPALGGCTASQFTGGTCAKVLGGYDFFNSDNDPMDNHGHGSHVAGIVASTDSTYRGIAPNASIIALNVCSNAGSCPNGNITAAIDWCVNNASRFNISVISISLGGGLYTSYCDNDDTGGAFKRPIDTAVVNNISVVAATGNQGVSATQGSTTQIRHPACIKNATAVSSTTKQDAIATTADRNNITDLLAPGDGITSVNYNNGGFTSISGTSMAAPHVSGAIALLAQYQKLVANTNLSPYAAFLALNTTGVNITDTGGSDIQFARINVYKALLSFDTTAPNLTIVAPTLANNTNSSSTNVFINITSNEVLQNASLEWNNVTHIINYSMIQNGSALYWVRNHSSSSIGVITYRVWGNDSAGLWGVTETRTVQVNNTVPRIDLFLPANINHNVTESANQTFNVTYTDTENDVVTIDWYVNGTLQTAARNTNFTFLGNFSQASQQSNGTYNITVVVSDGSLSSQLNWTLTINNTNRAPQWAGFANQTVAEDTPLNFTVVATDLDNDTITYYINNTVNFTINSSTGNITFNLSGAGNFSGTFYLALNASDGLANASELIFVNITPVNDTPTLFPISNVTVNETDFANITAVADDGDNDLLNFTVNDTLRFNFTTRNQSAANFSWKTNLSDAGTYQFRVNATDFGSSSMGFFNVTVIDRPDFDGDGLPDIYDSDDDNDGVADGDDSVLGNFSTLNSSTLSADAVNLTVNGSTNLSRAFNGTLFVNVTNGSRPLVEFFWNFSQGNLSLNFTVDVQNSTAAFGGIIVKGLRLQQNQTKNITVQNVNSTINSTCIRDADVASLGNISGSCNGSNETLVQCPGAFGGYNCSLSDDGSYYRITGANFTAAKEQCPDLDADGYYNLSCGLNNNDCNDNNAGISPGASDTCGNGVDEDCSGSDAACPSTQTSGSSGGGGGGGAAAQPLGAGTLAKVSQVFTLVRAGETAVMRINKSGIAFTKVRFTAAAALSSISMDVELLNSSNVSATLLLPSAERFAVYQYFRVTSKLTFLDISGAGIEFRVPKQWLSGSGFSSRQAFLYRYAGGSWDRMKTALFAEDSDYYFYSAELPAFSLFAVAAEEARQPAAVSNESARQLRNITVVAAANETMEISRGEMAERLLGKRGRLVIAAVAAALLLFAAVFAMNARRLKERERISDELSKLFRRARK